MWGKGISYAKLLGMLIKQILENRWVLSSTFVDFYTFWRNSPSPKYLPRKTVTFVHKDKHWETLGENIHSGFFCFCFFIKKGGQISQLKSCDKGSSKKNMLWTELFLSTPNPLPNSYVEAITLNVTIFEDGSFKEVIEVKWGHRVGPNSTTGVL